MDFDSVTKSGNTLSIKFSATEAIANPTALTVAVQLTPPENTPSRNQQGV